MTVRSFVRAWSMALALGAGSVGAAGDEVDVSLLQGMGDARHHLLSSQVVERDFHVFVRLPESYAEEPDTAFPTIYLLDGGITFPLLSGYYRYLSLAGDVPDAILVGIAYGSGGPEVNRRSTDFTAPSTERAHWGGATRFQEVLRKELFPLIEGAYRSDSGRRVLFGQSLGGQFVLYTALTEPTLFHGYIASNPALHRNLPLFLKPIEHEPTGARLFVASAENDTPRFREPALDWIAHWTAQGGVPWALRTMTLDGHNHFSAAPAAFRQGMLWIFVDR